MKAFVYTCLSLAALLAGPHLATAQGLTNLNLDSWVTRGNVEKPVNWLTTDDDYAYGANQPAGTYNFGLTTKTTDAHGGPYAAKMTTNTVTLGTQAATFPGELIFGTKTTYNDIGGAPLAAKPTAMTFYYKSTAPATDSTIALVYLTKIINGKYTVLAFGGSYLQPVTPYTAITLPISYDPNNSTTPDSIHIIFASGSARRITTGSILQVDDITFQGVTLAARAEADVQELLTVSPNPSTGGRFVISSPAKPELAAAPLQVLDLTGRTVLRQAAQPSPSGSRDLDLSAFSTGLYMLRLDTKEGTVVRQLTVK